MAELAERRDAAMNRRRLDLGMTWRQVAAAANISYETLRAVRKGDTAGGELTLSSIERALRWAPGAFAAIDAGSEPRTDTSAPDADQGGHTRELPPLEQELELAQRLLAGTVREMGLTPEEADVVWQRVKQELENAHTTGQDGPSRRKWRRRAG
ncbi:hypothetical protein [Streptomyces sp. NPDC048584]|uniref:hypothetical protein n=1 Tax=Streptomyces sp. NPDC048584 TaxID=3365573 RepID=UPI0037122BEB